MRRRMAVIFLTAAVVVFAVGAAYVSDYYHASAEVEKYLSDTENVHLLRLSQGILLDGPGEENALIFYPGGKVEYTSYLPLLHGIAAEGTDCFLVRMPMNLAVFGQNKATELMQTYQYQRWFIGGHSLGGAIAARYASDNDLDGLILLGAYPTKAVDEPTLELCGSEDRILNWEKREAGDAFLPEGSVTDVIQGGNHAQFGNYAEQKGDGEARISRSEQQSITVQRIREFISPSS